METIIRNKTFIMDRLESKLIFICLLFLLHQNLLQLTLLYKLIFRQ